MSTSSESSMVTVKDELRDVVAKVNNPDFDPDDVDTWFICLEAAFYVNRVAHDKYKFNAVIVALGPRAKFVNSAIAECQQSSCANKYLTLKAAILSHFRPSETERLTSLLSGMTLGDQKPSYLLSEMRRLGGTGCSDGVLSNLWLRALPNTTRAIIAAMPVNAALDEQARVADKIIEAPRNEIAAISNSDHQSTSSINSLENTIATLSRRLDDITTGNLQNNNRESRINYRSRFQSNSPSSSNRRASTPTNRTARGKWICYFHYQFGARAQKCEVNRDL